MKQLAIALSGMIFLAISTASAADSSYIVDIENARVNGAGDVIIIPASVAHGFGEIGEAITYRVVRIDPERIVALK